MSVFSFPEKVALFNGPTMCAHRISSSAADCAANQLLRAALAKRPALVVAKIIKPWLTLRN